MEMTRKSVLSLACIGLALALSTSASAQMMHHKGGMGGMGGPCADGTARVESRLAFLHSKLGITAAQESAFTAFAAASRKSLEPVTAACAARPAARPTTMPDRMDLHLKMMNAHVQQMTAMQAPTRTFYSSLTPAQQAMLDKMGGHGEHGEHGEHGPMPHGAPPEKK